MSTQTIVLFGYNEFAVEIADQVHAAYEQIIIYCLEPDEAERSRSAGFATFETDLDDDWEMMQVYPASTTRFVCALQNDAENLFLTISLRDTLPDALIVAVASTRENAQKLKLAGADKVITSLLTTSHLIIELLEKPVISRLFSEIMQIERGLEIAQIAIPPTSPYVGAHLGDLPFTEHDVIPLAVVDRRMSTSFIFTTRGHNHRLDAADVLVIVGYDAPIAAFRRAIDTA